MTETQTPNPDCPTCGGTGFIPPFMDACTCEAETPVVTVGNAVAFTRIGESSTTIDGRIVVWNGTEWVFVETEALTPAEYHAKYPKPHKSGDEMFDELMDEANAWDAAQKAVDEVDAEAAEFDVIDPTAVVQATMDAADEVDELTAEADALDAAEEAELQWPTVYTPPSEADFPMPSVPRGGVEIHADIYPVPSAPGSVHGKLATPAQTALLARLIAERDPSHPVVGHAIDKASLATLTTKEASREIDALMAVPATKQVDRPNKYDGSCRHCGGPVPAETGVIHKVDGRWQTSHKPDECLTAEAKADLEAERVTEPGLYKWDLSGPTVIYRVRKARISHRLYAEKVTVHDHDGEKHVEFAYNANAIAFLRSKDKLTWLEARDFGAAYGACVACGRTLSDPRSLVQQYGSTCAGHFGWPTVTKKQAEAIIEGVLTWDDVVAGLGVLTS